MIRREEIVAKAKMTVNTELCKGCMLCIAACPKNILKLDKGNMNENGYHVMHITDLDACILCANCAITCPDAAITLEKPEN